MALTLTVSGAVAIPLQDGSSLAPINLAATLGYTSKSDLTLNYTAPVSASPVPFGTLVTAGAKGLLVVCTAGSCTIGFNSGTDLWPLAPGGYFLWINTATPFPMAAAITTTGPASVAFLAVG